MDDVTAALSILFLERKSLSLNIHVDDNVAINLILERPKFDFLQRSLLHFSLVMLHIPFWALSVPLIVFVFIVTLIFIRMYRGEGSKLKGYIAVLLNAAHGLYRRSAVVHSFGRLFADRKQPKHVPNLDAVEKVSERAFRVLGLNPGTHTLQGTNTWLITGTQRAESSEHILIDTGEDITAKDYVKLLFNSVFPVTGTKRLEKILLTHGHGDHQGGVSAILKELSRRQMLPLPTIYKRKFAAGKESFPARGFEVMDIEDGQTFTIGSDTTITAIHTPGHTDDHVSFILEEDNALISGDCILGCGTTVFDDLYSYMQSLQRLRQIIVDRTIQRSNYENNRAHPASDAAASCAVSEVHTIYPGHGPVIRNSALEKIDEYISHRTLREKQIIRALKQQLRQQRQGQWLSSWELVDTVYGTLPLFVRVSAQWNVLHHLDKLEKEKRVVQQWPDLWQINSDSD